MLSTYNFLPSKAILSIHMWITKIVIKNMPIYNIECEVVKKYARYYVPESVTL